MAGISSGHDGINFATTTTTASTLNTAFAVSVFNSPSPQRALGMCLLLSWFSASWNSLQAWFWHRFRLISVLCRKITNPAAQLYLGSLALTVFPLQGGLPAGEHGLLPLTPIFFAHLILHSCSFNKLRQKPGIMSGHNHYPQVFSERHGHFLRNFLVVFCL